MPPAKERRKRPQTKPTMVQVAKSAGVSIFTVSAVVNGTSTVSPQLRERVEAAIRETGYTPSATARSLRTGRTRTIGLTVGDITNPFYTDLTSRLQRVLHAADYAVMLCSSQRDVSLQDEQIALLRSRQVDGLILAPTGDDAALRAALAEFPAPVVLVDRILDGYDCDTVLLDNRAAVADALGYLIGLGHRRIGFISGVPETYTARERSEAWRATLDAAGIDPDPELEQLGNFRTQDAYEAALRLMALRTPPTAIFASNNMTVIGVMKALRHLGLNCPGDVSLAAIDDFPWADAFEPRLTTVAQPVDRFGDEAARLLLERLDGSVEGPGRRIVLSGELRIRSSCRPLAGAAALRA